MDMSTKRRGGPEDIKRDQALYQSFEAAGLHRLNRGQGCSKLPHLDSQMPELRLLGNTAPDNQFFWPNPLEYSPFHRRSDASSCDLFMPSFDAEEAVLSRASSQTHQGMETPRLADSTPTSLHHCPSQQLFTCSLNLSGDEGKNKAREKNRDAQRRFREKQKTLLAVLQQQCDQKDKIIAKLQREKHMVEQHNQCLLRRIWELESMLVPGSNKHEGGKTPEPQAAGSFDALQLGNCGAPSSPLLGQGPWNAFEAQQHFAVSSLSEPMPEWFNDIGGPN